MTAMKIHKFPRPGVYFADPAPDGGGGAAGAQPPDLAKLVSWDEEADGPIPDDLKAVPLDKVREYVSKHTTDVAAKTEAQVRQSFLDERERERGAQQSRAELEKEISWQEDLDKRRNSPDAAVREAAVAEYTRNEQRYVEALAGKHTMRQRISEAGVLQQHYQPQWESLAAAGYEGFVKELPDLTKKHGSILLATLEHGKSIGDAEGYARGLDEGKRAGRVDDNAGGSQAAANASSRAGGDRPAIDMTKPGGGAAAVRAALASRKQQPRR